MKNLQQPDKLPDWQACLMLVWLALLTLVALHSVTPPAARPANAPVEEFSANRALLTLREIANLPHPQGASEHERVRNTLLNQLRQLGLSPHLQTRGVVSARNRRPYRAATVHNIWARIPGRASTGTLLLAAHYDSVNTGPGASDDGASVAALLETLRALQTTRKTPSGSRSPSPNPLPANFNFRNDILVLLTDGEETGLLGSRAFVNKLQEKGKQPSTPFLVLNFEARGTAGPSLMFETSEGNGWLVRQFATAALQPLGSSLFYAVYKLLPNDTDFTEFRGAGMSGLNFAYLNGVAHYHTSLDDIQHLDLRSLQHQGDNMLGLARRFGNEALTQAKQPDVIYFNGGRNWLCVYPQSWAVPLALLATALAFVVIAQRWRRIVAPGWYKAIATFGAVVWVGLAVVAAILALAGLTYWTTSGAVTARMTLYLDGVTLAGVLLLCVGGVLLLLDAKFLRPQSGTKAGSAEAESAEAAKAERENAAKAEASGNDKGGDNKAGEYASASLPLRLTFDAVQMGAIVWWLILAWLTAVLLPEGSYLFVWPLLGVLLAQWAQGAWLQNREEGKPFSVVMLLCLMLGAVPAILLIVPVLCLLFATLSLSSFTIIGALTALTVALLRPQFRLGMNVFPGHWQALPVLLAGTGMVLLWVGAEVLQPSEAHPRSNSLFYALNADTNVALWASNDRKPDAWTAKFLGDHPKRNSLPEFLPVSSETFFHAPAPVTPLAPPVATVQEDRVEDGVRTLRLLLTSPRHAPIMEIALLSDANVLNIALAGQPVQGKEENHDWSLLYFNMPKDGLILIVRLSPASPLALRLIDRSYGLPSIPDKTYPPRPTDMIASPSSGWYQDTTLIAKTYRF